MTIGQKIAVLRTAMQISQEQLAEKLEVSRQSVSKWESDQSVPEVSKILQLSSIFNVTTDDLLRDEIPLAPTLTENLFKPKESIVFNGRYFGTDGFRGEANTKLTAIHAFKIGRFLGWYYSKVFSEGYEKSHKARIVIGKDTRRSSYMLEYAIVAGITSSGADAYMLHVTTTPSVSYVVRQDYFDCGVMISASHNPYFDNGIKLINRAGEKMDDKTLALIEDYIDGDLKKLGVEGDDLPLASREKVGCVIDYVAGRNRYVGFLISVAANSYRNLKVALDCANGSSWMIARSVFSALGAQVHVINAEPDGLNINEQAGSTHIGILRKYVRDNQLDVGFAFDGDADRCIAVDENGNTINGDHVLFVIARRLRDKGLLPGNKVVTTIMSNMGLYKALDDAGIGYVQTTVGDRYVHDAMMENNYYLGGEQSGHTIIRKYATTGDGILTAIMLLEEMVDKKATLGELAAPVTMYPQSIRNVYVTDKAAVAANEEVKKMVAEITEELGKNGRILLRESGTEPVIRVMVESGSQKVCDSYTAKVEELIDKLGFVKKDK
ncbi:MAG: phosphoglucosamine mutase [Ruminococcaceae bacterium]|nr:phosphoglucosamine mutase [Oscillospiraceae bacterium]